MFSLVNSARLLAGKSSLGWVNPALYLYAADSTTDITSGNNNCAAEGIVCCSQGFESSAGWDPVTGLGTLNFAGFKKKMLSLGDL
jgi:tripeptidyl-peptidase-1